MKPWRAQMDFCFVAEDQAKAFGAINRLAAAAWDVGFFRQSSHSEPMDPAEVVPGSPLARELRRRCGDRGT
jgi:hypothetical protein